MSRFGQVPIPLECERQPMTSPFDEPPRHPAALWAVEDLRSRLKEAGELADGIPLSALQSEKGGTMLGVLVVRRPNQEGLHYICAFAGEVAERVLVPGWAPPMYHVLQYTEHRVIAESGLAHLAREEAKEGSQDRLAQLREAHAVRVQGAQVQLDGLRQRKKQARAQRKAQRVGASQEQLRILERQSQHDNARLTEDRRSIQAALATSERGLQRAQRRVEAWRRLRRYRSQQLLRKLQMTYTVPSAHSGERSLPAVFAPAAPPGGAGDCAGAKLVAWALTLGLEPVALAETWWGASPPGGGRLDGALYPACVSKCGPLMRFMLDGVPMQDALRSGPNASQALSLPVIYEDEAWLVIDKPAGLLSVPGRKEQDSAQLRLQQRHPGLRAVHRLDQDASGVLLFAKTAEALRWGQAEFSGRRVQKAYVALLDGRVEGEGGEIRLAFRLDPEQRPRQVYDPERGKLGVSRWRVLEVHGARTRVQLEPITGRTHQLRCHMAHEAGLNAPIVGDRLYGRGGGRLMLHARQLELTSFDGARLRFEAKVPF